MEMRHCGQRGLRLGMEGGRKNDLGPGTRKRTWARSGRVEAGFKAERVRENGRNDDNYISIQL